MARRNLSEGVTLPFKDSDVRREHQREYQRRYNHGPKGREARRKHDRKRCKDPERIAWVTRYRRYYQKNPQYREKKKKYAKRIREIWQNGVKLPWGMGSANGLIRESENYAQHVALPQLGFQNITKMFKMFPFDFIGDLNGEVCLIDVTMTKSRAITKKSKLATRLKLPFYVLFLRPDKSFFYLKKMDPNSRTASVPIRQILVLGQHIKKGATTNA